MPVMESDSNTDAHKIKGFQQLNPFALHRVLAVLSAIGLKLKMASKICFSDLTNAWVSQLPLMQNEHYMKLYLPCQTLA